MSMMKRKRGTKRTHESRSMSVRRSLAPSYGRMTRIHAAPGVGVGASVNTTLRTSFFANVTSPGNSLPFTAFLKPGSAFDPCGSLADIQPPGFDSWAAAFSRYKVNSALVVLTIHGTSGSIAGTNASQVYVAAAYPSVNSSLPTTYQGAASQPYAKTRSGCFNCYGAASTPANLAGAPAVRMKFKLSNDKIVGFKGDATDTGALVTSDPPTGQFMLLPIFLQPNENATAAWVVEVDIWQNVTFSQRKTFVDA